MKVIHANLGEVNHLTLENMTNTIAQTAPTMVPMRRPLRGARWYWSLGVLLWVVIVVPWFGVAGVSYTVVVGVGGLGWRWWGSCLGHRARRRRLE